MNTGLTFKLKHTHYFMTSITALFNQKQSKCYLCRLFTFIEVGQQRPLQIKNSLRAGIRTRGRLPLLHVLLLFTLSHTPNVLFCTCFLSLNAAIQNSESNHHSDKTLLQVWNTHAADDDLFAIHNPEHMCIPLIGKTYRCNFSYLADADIYI